MDLLGELSLQQLFEQLSLGKKTSVKEGAEQKKEENKSGEKNEVSGQDTEMREKCAD